MLNKQNSKKLLRSKSLSYKPSKLDIAKEVIEIQKPITEAINKENKEENEEHKLDFTQIYKNTEPIIELKIEEMIQKPITEDREKMLYQNAIKKWRNSAKL